MCLLGFSTSNARNWSAEDDFYQQRYTEEFSDLIYEPYPTDLIPENMSAEEIDYILSKGENLFTASKSSQRRIAQEDEKILDITTTEYGQLSLILDEKHGETATKIIVSGPMDWVDFAALWDCAIEDNLIVLDLKNAQIKDNTIPDYALYDPIQFSTGHWLAIEKIILPENIVKIGIAAFPMMRLTEINIPSSLQILGDTAFAYDYWLNCKMVIPEGVEDIGHQVFDNCRSLWSAPILPSSLKKIKSGAFFNTPFEHIGLNEGLEFIGSGAFQSSGLKDLSIPESIVEIEPMAFQLCAGLEQISLPETLEEISYGLFSFCYGLKEIKIPSNAKVIAPSAFMSCTRLRKVIFQESLELIDKEAFYGCAIDSLILPRNLKTIVNNCFSILNLQTVYCESETPPLCESGDHGGPFLDKWISRIVLYVPVGCKELYAAQWQWNMFKEIIETDEFPTSRVEAVMPGKVIDRKIYDLYGREIATPAPGQIYIQDGKKMVSPR